MHAIRCYQHGRSTARFLKFLVDFIFFKISSFEPKFGQIFGKVKTVSLALIMFFFFTWPIFSPAGLPGNTFFFAVPCSPSLPPIQPTTHIPLRRPTRCARPWPSGRPRRSRRSCCRPGRATSCCSWTRRRTGSRTGCRSRGWWAGTRGGSGQGATCVCVCVCVDVPTNIASVNLVMGCSNGFFCISHMALGTGVKVARKKPP